MTETHATGTVALLRSAAADWQTTVADMPDTFRPFAEALAGWWEAAADREQARIDYCRTTGTDLLLADPEPGDEIHAALALAQAWMGTG